MALSISGWALVALVNVAPDGYLAKGVMPVITNLTFDSLANCLKAEEEMRQAWADHYNLVKKSGAEKTSLEFTMSQMVRGTCIPHQRDN
jgi:hypothetical protein